ncbi:CRISPR system precrRNA processing endoribonuclease RAMP protein Cas6 [Marinimicrobium sp. ARAG 43.8]|uniref:CRISPR system precrRNA processing endoribonuclease RAMP protein Cas6 n=1 Tax=Marinimicrobium sp. ARAG 43.8 TaxID=3418719 RepID=UPI003CF68379
MIDTCPYPAIFEPQVTPRASGQPPALAPYSIETPFDDAARPSPQSRCYQPGEHYRFDMVLMTPIAIQQLPLIIASWERAFSYGVGPLSGTAKLTRVEQCQANGSADILYSTEKPQLQRHNTELSVPRLTLPMDIQLHLKTPLRLQQKGRLVSAKDLTPGLFLRNLIRRVSFHVCTQQPDAYTLADIHQLNTLADQVQEGERELTWSDWQRYSSRQKQKMTLGGLIGHWQLLHVPPALLHLIYLGQWLHIGKEATFGLGHYVMIPSSELEYFDKRQA